MSREKTEEPGSAASIAAGFLAAAVGVVLGLVYFISFPLESYGSIAQRDAALEKKESPYRGPADSYYFEGNVLRTDSWKAARTQLLSGDQPAVAIQAGELNAWLTTFFAPDPGAVTKDAGGILIHPSALNISLAEAGRMFLNLPAEIHAFGLEGEFVLSATGYFGPGPAPSFKIKDCHLNGARLPGLVGKQLLGTLTGAYKKTDEYGRVSEAWRRVEAVELLEGSLRLSLD